MKREKVILIAERNAWDAEQTLGILRENDVACRTAVTRDGQEALEFVFGTGRHADRPLWHLPELIILSLRLPGAGGAEVVRRLRRDERTRSIPVILTGTEGEQEALKRLASRERCAWAVKPLNLEKLRHATKSAGAFSLLVRSRVSSGVI